MVPRSAGLQDRQSSCVVKYQSEVQAGNSIGVLHTGSPVVVHAESPAVDVDNPDVDADNPAVEADNHAVEADSPAVETDSPVVVVEDKPAGLELGRAGSEYLLSWDNYL